MQSNPTVILVVAVALIAADGRVLMQRRKLGAAHGGLWEFPGGKIEPGETAEAALVREIAEELGVVLEAGDLVPVGFASDPVQPPDHRQPHLILLYFCRRWQGSPRCLDGEKIGWFASDKLEGLAMPPLDYPLARALENCIFALANRKTPP